MQGNNGKLGAPLTKAELISWGSGAYLNNDFIKAFPIGNLHSFAEKELPAVIRALDLRTIGDLAALTRSEISGPQSRNAGNKTLAWIEAVCWEFDIEPPKHGEPINT